MEALKTFLAGLPFTAATAALFALGYYCTTQFLMCVVSVLLLAVVVWFTLLCGVLARLHWGQRK